MFYGIGSGGGGRGRGGALGVVMEHMGGSDEHM